MMRNSLKAEMRGWLEALELHVCDLAGKDSFIHHKWYVRHHLKIVEQLSNELCDIYPDAQRDIVLAMVWLHDYGKILTSKQLTRHQEDEVTFTEGRKKMEEIGFPSAFIGEVISNLRIFEQSKERDLKKENIEIQIASTADGCAHLIGPFFSLYWYENPHENIETLIQSSIKKAQKDWNQKVVLPQARKAFEPRMLLIMEHDKRNREKLFFRETGI